MSVSAFSYAGDEEVGTVWDRLAADPSAVLVDVRTRAEWTFVGLPDLRPVGRSVCLIEWQTYPNMSVNPAFLDELAAAVGAPAERGEGPIYFLCRSGARSRSAAVAATAAGFRSSFNVADGFEGPLGPDGRRGGVAGWKAAGLPWTQS